MPLGQILFSLYSCMIVSALFSLGCRFLRLSEFLQKCVLWLEFALFFIAVPILFTLSEYSPLQIMLIINFCCLCILIIYSVQHITMLCEWIAEGKRPSLRGIRRHWKQAAKTLLTRILLSTFGLSVLLLFLRPTNFLAPLRQPGWILLIAIYSMISAPPQEFVYRKFFFQRYRLLFPSDRVMLLMSSLSFSFVHIIFRHPIPLLLTFIAGYWFSQSYQRYNSLLLPSIEHALYGSLAFSIGYHTYFHFV